MAVSRPRLIVIDLRFKHAIIWHEWWKESLAELQTSSGGSGIRVGIRSTGSSGSIFSSTVAHNTQPLPQTVVVTWHRSRPQGQHKPPQVISTGSCRDWLTNQNTHWCFVVIGLGRKTSHSPLQQLKIDPVRQLGPPYWLASSGGQRIFINIRGQYGIQKNIYIHPWSRPYHHHLLRINAAQKHTYKEQQYNLWPNCLSTVWHYTVWLIA